MIIKLFYCDFLLFVNINLNSWGYFWEKYFVFYIIFIDICIIINFFIIRFRNIKFKLFEFYFYIYIIIIFVIKCEISIRRGFLYLFIVFELGVNELK